MYMLYKEELQEAVIALEARLLDVNINIYCRGEMLVLLEVEY